MSRSTPILALSLVLATMGFSQSAHAQFAVIDVAALGQLIQEVQQMEQEIQTAQSQLTQARQQYQSMTGTRGMQSLLSGTNRNYLPSSWAQLSTSLAGPIRTQMSTNAVLPPAQIAALSPAEQRQLNAARGNAAQLQVAAQDAYSNASGRFASIQQLINAIGSASDEKGILDLEARIQGEQGMLQNEATKLTVLYQAAQAQEWARNQTAREQVIAGVGNLRTLQTLRIQ
jgi:type IV secretion system protein VirB5